MAHTKILIYTIILIVVVFLVVKHWRTGRK